MLAGAGLLAGPGAPALPRASQPATRSAAARHAGLCTRSVEGGLFAAAVGALAGQHVGSAGRAEVALERADTCLGRFRRQVLVAAFAAGTQLKYGVSPLVSVGVGNRRKHAVAAPREPRLSSIGLPTRLSRKAPHKPATPVLVSATSASACSGPTHCSGRQTRRFTARCRGPERYARAASCCGALKICASRAQRSRARWAGQAV